MTTDLLRSEWTKLTSLRSTAWSLIAMVVLSLGFTVLATSLMTGQYDTMDAATRTQFDRDTLGLILEPGAQFAQVAVCVLGVLLMASEFATGMIRSTVLAVPRRTPVLLAKAATFGGLTFVLGELVALPCYLIGRAVTSSHSHLALDATTVRALLAFGGYLALTGVFALAVGTLIRHPAGGISAVLALQFVLPGVLSALPGSAASHIAQALPAGTNVMLGSGHNPTDLYSPLTAFLILLAWTGAATLLAGWSLRRRNV